MFYEYTQCIQYICKYMGRGGGGGGGGERGTNGSSYIRCKIFRFSEHTKAPSAASKVPPPTHTQTKIGICIEIKYSPLWAGGGSTLLEII
jgi:hypothetical protein